MSLIEADRTAKRAAEIVDMAVRTLAADLGVSHSEASIRLFVAVGRTMTHAAVTEAVNQIRRLTMGVPCIG